MNLTLVAKAIATPAVAVYFLEWFIRHVPLPTTRFSTGLLDNTISVSYDAVCGSMDLVSGVLGIHAAYLLLWSSRLVRVGVNGYSSPDLDSIGSLLDMLIGFQIFSVSLVTYKR